MHGPMTIKTLSRAELADLETRAVLVADQLRALANERRLMILCRLIEHGEMRVGDLVGSVAVSQSALSQHLAVLRAEGLVTYRREAQVFWYRIADPRVERLLATFQELYCRD